MVGKDVDGGYSSIAPIAWDKPQSYWLKQDSGNSKTWLGWQEPRAGGQLSAESSGQAFLESCLRGPCAEMAAGLCFLKFEPISRQDSFLVGVFSLIVHTSHLRDHEAPFSYGPRILGCSHEEAAMTDLTRKS